ncbi:MULTISPECIES: DarT ssDNA thymidine ADP-ribosyltransferase family protein [Yersinia]|uniref:DarT ssDNA thymidine ADP-ribosyltransferase family protein n=1 Tax=Yersinia TaxID=629 RepID=UPI000BFD5003|nr:MULTISPECIES: DarT ssDNA thymidine ADP-ribosyltransferase family protein [Yersinia]ATM87636.1 hypothetical protein CRN74_17040 [Yersinia frederiksenii]MCB5319285.1 DUF4433 domain-containing protein [Yersinia massiliensis]
MLTVIGIFFVLAVIGNILNKNKTPPPSSQNKPPASSHEPLQFKETSRRVSSQRRTLLANLPPNPPSLIAPPAIDGESLSIGDATALLNRVEGFRDFLLTRYAITGLTHLPPAYTSDLHYAFMREIGHIHFYAIQQFDWRGLVNFASVMRKPVPALYHFTHISNLQSVLEHGILTRHQLESSGKSFRYNDALRLDGVRDSISLSLGHVNNKMLFKYTQGLRDHEWVILKIKPELISGPTSPSFDHAHLLQYNVFCRNNAASSEMTSVSIAERQTYRAFQNLFADESGENGGERPYDVQAEILHQASIPVHFISGIIFYAKENVPLWLTNSKANIVVDPVHFSFR